MLADVQALLGVYILYASGIRAIYGQHGLTVRQREAWKEWMLGKGEMLQQNQSQ